MKLPWQIASTLLVVAVVLTSGCGKPTESERYVRPDQVTNFHELFQQNCSGCHGKDGNFGPAPPLNDPLFQAIVSDEQLNEVITNGRPNTQMPAFGQSKNGPFTEAQVKIVVEGIRELWAQPVDEKSANLPAYQVSADDPAGIAEGDLARGKTLFSSVCADCHGESGQGGNAGSLDSHAFGELVSNQLLRRIIITGRPDLKMPNFMELGRKSSLERPLTSQEIVDLTAYLRSLDPLAPKIPTPEQTAFIPSPEHE